MNHSADCIIAPLGRDDLPALAALYGQLADHEPDHAAMAEVYGRMADNPDYILLGAKSPDGTLMGTVMGVLCLDLAKDCRPFMVMENMVVHHDHHRKGVGLHLVEALEAVARDRRCFFMEFCSSSFRKGAHQFYHAAGYDQDLVKGFRKFFP